jgi:hypothetical protein
MRNNQVSIKVERFNGDEDNLGTKAFSISAYADSNNLYESLAAANFEAMQQIQEKMAVKLPTFGRRESYPVSSFEFEKIFDDFLKVQSCTDEWHEFKKNSLTLEQQFIHSNNMDQDYDEFKKLQMKKFLDKNKKNKN